MPSVSNWGFEWFDTVEEGDILKENTESLEEMQVNIDRELKIWADRKAKLNSVLFKRYSLKAANARQKDSGVIHLKEEDTGYIITCNARKEVSYDQVQMTQFWDNITASKDNPLNYMKMILEISEKTWNSWGIGSWQQKAFLSARTVKIRESFVIVPPKEQEK